MMDSGLLGAFESSIWVQMVRAGMVLLAGGTILFWKKIKSSITPFSSMLSYQVHN
jgi:hypothetical protein